MQAADDLREAMDNSGPAISGIVATISQQLRGARTTFERTLDFQETNLIAPTRYGNIPAAYTELHREQVDLERQYASALAAGDAASATQLRGRLEQVTLRAAPLRERFTQYERDLQQVRKTRAEGFAVIDAAIAAVSAWQTSPHELERAVRERRPYTVQSLITAVQRVRDLVEEAESE